MIAAAEKNYIKDYFCGKEIFEIPTEVFLHYERFIFENAREDNYVFITGGGWMGSLWPEDEMNLQHMIAAFSKNKTTILPQTIYFDKEDTTGCDLLKSANDIILKAHDLRICVRDLSSYHYAIDNIQLSAERVMIAPDMALYYRDTSKDIKPQKRVGLYLRKDREKVSEEEVLAHINRLLGDMGYDFYVSDTMYSRMIPIWQRDKLIEETISNMKRCQIIVTDRLHAMIYATIANRICVVFNNKTGKVNGVYSKWLNWNKNILYLDDVSFDVIDSRIKGLINQSPENKNVIDILKPEFDKLKKFITA